MKRFSGWPIASVAEQPNIVSAPAFAQIAGFDLQYLEVPPDQKVP